MMGMDPATAIQTLPDGTALRRVLEGEILLVGDLYGDDLAKLEEYTQRNLHEYGTLTYCEDEMQPFWRKISPDRNAPIPTSFVNAATRFKGVCIRCEKPAMIDISCLCDACRPT